MLEESLRQLEAQLRNEGLEHASVDTCSQYKAIFEALHTPLVTHEKVFNNKIHHTNTQNFPQKQLN